MSAIRTWLDAQDGPLVVGLSLLALVLLWALCLLVVALAKVDRQPRPRRESMSERHERLDREAEAAARAQANGPAYERLGRSANR